MTYKIRFILFFLITFFTCNRGFAESLSLLDSKVILLSLPKDMNIKWKELQRIINNCKDAVIEIVPEKQNSQNFTDLITIQTLGKPEENDQSPYKLKTFLKSVKETALSSYPGSKVTWDLIEEHENDAVYEWQLHKKYKDIPAQHEITRLFVTDSTVYQVGFMKKGKMKPEERELWTNILKQNVSLVDAKEAVNSTDISMVGWLKECITPTDRFSNWQPISSFHFTNGYCITCFAPPSLKVGGYLDECLEVINMRLGRE